VLRYADVQQVMLDPATFSSQRIVNADGSVDESANGGFLGLDPPRHRQLRSLVAHAFTQRRIAELEPRIRQITDSIIDSLQVEETIDIVACLAFPLPVAVIGDLLGVPRTDVDQFRSWTADLVGLDYPRRIRAFGLFAQYFGELVTQRARSPENDLVSDFLRAEVDGLRLDHHDIVNTCTLLLVAGHETTTSLIGTTLWCLEEQTEVREHLCGHPERLAGAIEEVLRTRGVVHYMPRVVTRDLAFLGAELQEGDVVLPLFAAANLDPEQFPAPERFDPSRFPNRHLGFGFGIHLCLGASLARLEARIAVGRLLERFPHLRRDHSRPSKLRPSHFVYALQEYPVRLAS
jgi:cytochrome P450